MMPRRFFLLFDVVVLFFTFLTAYELATHVQLGLPKSMHLNWVWEWLSIEPAPSLRDIRPLAEVVWLLLVMIATTFVSMTVLRGYTSLLDQSRARIVFTAIASPCVGLAFVSLVLFALKSPRWSRLFVFSYSFLAFAGLCAYRLVLRTYWRRRAESGCYAKHVVVVGPHNAIIRLARLFEETVPKAAYILYGFLAVEEDERWREFEPKADGCRHDVPLKLPKLGDVRSLDSILIQHPVQEVLAVSPSAGGEWLAWVISQCDYYRATLRIVPEALLAPDLKDLHFMYRSDPLHLPEIVLSVEEPNGEMLFLKRLMDVSASALALLILSPLFLMIAVSIKTTTPCLPVLYRYRQVGHLGKAFFAFKFTTMIAGAEQQKANLLQHNEMTGPVFKIKNDPRITKLGAVLRKYSLNELPQLWNVLKGDMSLVGPRAALPEELRGYELWQKRRLSVRPGLTCLWQTRGRNRISSFDDWVRMDLEYIDNWSIWLDVKLVIKTIWVVMSGSGS